MANNPNDHDPKPAPHDPSAVPQAGGSGAEPPFDLDPDAEPFAQLPDESLFDKTVTVPTPIPDEVPFDPPVPEADPASVSSSGVGLGDLPDLAEVPEAELSGLMRPAAPASDVLKGGPDLPDSFPEVPVPADPTPSAEVSLDDLSDLPELPAAGLSGMMHASVPASGGLKGGPESGILEGEPIDEEATTVANFEPVAPASGWLDEDAPTEVNEGEGPAAHLEVTPADVFEALPEPEPVESSDIFVERVYGAAPAASSDVIVATAITEAASAEPVVPPKADRPSEVALSFEQPPGGSTMQEVGGSGDLPVADELAENSQSLFDALGEEPSSGLFDSATLAETPLLPETDAPPDAPDYGATPAFTPDASSILSDLTEPAERPPVDTSAVRLDAPGVERTHGGGVPSSTEFDLEVSDDAIPPELLAAEADAAASAARPRTGESGLFDATAAGPAPRADDESAEVEFTDQPTADDETAASRVFNPPTPRPARHKTPPDEVDFELPATAAHADRETDWGAADDDEAVGFSHAAPDAPPGSGRRGKTPAAEETGRTAPGTPRAKDKAGRSDRSVRPVKLSAVPPEESSSLGPNDPSMEIDWMSGSSTEEPITFGSSGPASGTEEERTRPAPKLKAGRESGSRGEAAPKPGREPAGPRKGGGLLTGAIIGLVIGGGGVAGAYFADLLPKSSEKPDQANAKYKSGPTAPPTIDIVPGPGAVGTTPAAKAATPADVAAAVRAGDPAKAKQLAAALNDTTAAGKAAAGEAGLFAAYQGQKGAGPLPADNPDLKAARENLRAVVDDAAAAKTPEGERAAVKAAVQLGLTYRLAGDPAAARKVYEAAIKRFPRHAATFEANLIQLDAAPGDGASRRLTPADAEAVVALLFLLQEPAANPAADEPEAGVFFWKAVQAARAGEYAKAVEEIAKAKAAHVTQAKAAAGRGLNPLSDPLEQIFPKACADLKAYWELRAAIYGNKAVAELFNTAGAEKALAELAAAQKKAGEAVALMEKLTDANTKLATAEKGVKDAEKLAKEAAKKLDDQQKAYLVAEGKLKEEIAKADKDRLAAGKEAKERADVVAALAKELQAVKILPEKFDTAALLAAQKTAMERATGPNLASLLPAGAMAVGGGGLTAGQLIDISGRLAKAEAGARTAAEKLATETRRLNTEHEADLKKLKDTHTTDVKKLTDAFATKTKELMDAYATNTGKLKDDHAAGLKKAGDVYAADLKKLTDDNAVATKKLTDGFEGKVKTLEAAVAEEKERAGALAAKFKADLGNALSPSQALDLWLPLLTDLRREADADPALAAANKVLAAAPADSEDAAKARTVAGVALLLKGDREAARPMLQRAKASPAHRAAAGRAWAKAADAALESVDDPLAPYRVAVTAPERDPRASARFLDDGIKAYRNGRYPEAAAALDKAVKADPANATAWYFLGATEWARGSTDQAKDDFRQGAAREAASSTPGRVISAALAPIQGPARSALDAARP